jgi:hypothetical protein
MFGYGEIAPDYPLCNPTRPDRRQKGPVTGDHALSYRAILFGALLVGLLCVDSAHADDRPPLVFNSPSALNEYLGRQMLAHFQGEMLKDLDAPGPYSAIRIVYGRMGRDVRDVAEDGRLLRTAHRAKWSGALDEAERALGTLLVRHFANPETHLLLRDVYGQRGDSAGAEREHKIFLGFLRALLTSGDGKTPETAYLVQSIAEEYFILGFAARCEPKTRWVHTPPGAGAYDAHLVSCGGTEHTVYFDISAWELDPEWRLKVYGGGRR